MSVRTRDWLKFVALVGLAFVFGLAFASALNLPKQGSAAEASALLQAPPPTPAQQHPIVPAAKPVAELGDAFVAISEQVKPAVVFIRSEIQQRTDTRKLPPGFDDFFPQFRHPQPRVEEGSGSGFIVSPDGYILTNNHVVAGASHVTVRLLDKRQFDAHVVGADPQTDVAVIKIDATNLATVSFGNSDSTHIGEWVLAIGNPLGDNFTFTVTAGIVSAKGRLLAGLNQSKYAIQDFIQTDAAINPGNSGGPLVNIHGEVIGINSAIASETGFYSGYGFAIPINLARTVMSQLITHGKVQRAVMGISIHDATQEDAAAVGLTDIRGVVVDNFTDNSPAQSAGLLPGDLIVDLDGQPVEYTAQLQQRVAFKKPGEPVQVTVLRQGGARKVYTVHLAAAPDEKPEEIATTDSGKEGSAETVSSNRLGVAVEPLTQDDASQDARLRAVVRQGGALVVSDVSADGPSYRKLFSADQGGPDLIVRINGKNTGSRADFRNALQGVKAGDIVTLEVLSRAADGWQQRVVRVRAR
ncbi:MAG TPA: Do family serine endopeptidase [Gemmatimonadales bacterium]|nr:Do family serine endopeptidase [Gemmatimonadales bacterium]